MEDWKDLCNGSGTRDRVFSKLEEIGICAHLKHTVQSKVEDHSIHIGDLKSTLDTIVNSSGTVTHSHFFSFTLNTLRASDAATECCLQRVNQTTN